MASTRKIKIGKNIGPNNLPGRSFCRDGNLISQTFLATFFNLCLTKSLKLILMHRVFLIEFALLIVAKTGQHFFRL